MTAAVPAATAVSRDHRHYLPGAGRRASETMFSVVFLGEVLLAMFLTPAFLGVWSLHIIRIGATTRLIHSPG